jgi:hypothetical protein
MKRLIIALFALLALSACSSTESRVEAVAESFLNVYYAGDYAAAADYCTPDFAEHVVSAGSEAELPADLQLKIKEAVSQTSFDIVSVELDEDAASALVRYELHVPDLEKPVPKALRLQLEGRTALVDGIE